MASGAEVCRSYRQPEILREEFLLLGRQEDCEHRPAMARSSAAFHTNRTMVAFHDPLANPEAQPGSHVLFRGEEWLEQPRSDFRWYADARIGDREPHSRPSAPAPLGSGRDTHANTTCSRDGIDAVAQQI